MLRETLSTTRLRDLKGTLATLVLEARAQGQPLEVVVELPYVTRGTLDAAREFMGRVAPEVSFRLEGKDGTAGGNVGLLRLRNRERGEMSSSSSGEGATSGELFTDLHRWLLKYLLLYAPAQGSAHSLRTLAEAAEVSFPTVQRFVDAFSDLGFVVNDGGYVVVRKEELFRRWFAAQDAMRDARIPARSLTGVKKLLADLAAPVESGTASAAVGGYAACDARGMLHVLRPGPIEVHVDGRAMGALSHRFRRCERHEADVILLPSAWCAASVFRAAALETLRVEGLPVVDAIQAALDVWTIPLGGQEQARFVVDTVFGGHDGD